MRIKAVFIVLIGTFVVGVAVLASEPRKLRILHVGLGTKVVEWSEYRTDERTTLRYRIGLSQKQGVLDDEVRLGMLIEISNTGKDIISLRSLSFFPSDESQLVSWFYVDGKAAGYSPVFSDAVEKAILLKPGESWVQILGFPLSEKLEPGRHEIVVAFGILQKRGNPLRRKTAPVTVAFKEGSEESSTHTPQGISLSDLKAKLQEEFGGEWAIEDIGFGPYLKLKDLPVEMKAGNFIICSTDTKEVKTVLAERLSAPFRVVGTSEHFQILTYLQAEGEDVKRVLRIVKKADSVKKKPD